VAAQSKRVAARRGKKRALVAVGHTLPGVVYAVLKKKGTYRELGADYLDRQDKEKLELLELLELPAGDAAGMLPGRDLWVTRRIMGTHFMIPDRGSFCWRQGSGFGNGRTSSTGCWPGVKGGAPSFTRSFTRKSLGRGWLR
jgi:hypothetical protein